jgi:pimeloyl-ACP methyl ester carboxylesterase
MSTLHTRWQTYKYEGRTVEGQLWEADKPSGRAVLFCPGFPGRGGTVFEQRHAHAIVDAGYSLIVLRHNGIIMNGPDAPFMINNSGRLQHGRRNGETHLGGGPSTMEAWLWEPFTALGALTLHYDDILVIGNSFGAASMLWSVTRPNAPLDRVRSLICLAGAQGIADDPMTGIMRIWTPALLSTPLFWEKIALDPPAAISATMAKAYAELPALVKKLPERIAMKYLVVMADEILRPSDAEAFKAAIGGRGEIVTDSIDRAYPSAGLLAHDMPDYPSDRILALLKDSSP